MIGEYEVKKKKNNPTIMMSPLATTNSQMEDTNISFHLSDKM